MAWFWQILSEAGRWLASMGGYTLDLTLDAAPWLLLGLIVAGLLKAFLPDRVLSRWIGGRGWGPVVRAAVIGAPLPLCSCGVIPAAVGVRRQGASPGATVSFLVATPETGVDSVAVSYALLGPFLMIVRPVAAIISAMASGLSCQWLAGRVAPSPAPIGGGAPSPETAPSAADCCGTEQEKSSDCCSDNPGKKEAKSESDASCCGSEPADSCCEGKEQTEGRPVTRWQQLRGGMQYAAGELMDEIWPWMLAGLLAAGAVRTFVPPATLEALGSGLPAMGVMVVVGVPMYICATASTPLAAALLLAGVSPGTVLVFLLAGPATNIATIGVIRRQLGTAIVAGYLVSIAVTSIALGLATDALAQGLGINVASQVGEAGEAVPLWLAWATLVLLLLLVIRPVRRLVL
jgi:uncharacterized membrane protein YraQ (UPF0718 family)